MRLCGITGSHAKVEAGPAAPARYVAAAMTTAPRIVHCTDGLQWLQANPLPADHAVLTSLPDSSELRRLPFADWQAWFTAAAAQVVRAVPPQSAAIFYQTDVKRSGSWVDKAFLVQQGAYQQGARLLWHKVVCRAPAGTATGNRPGYAHLLCFSQQLVEAPAATSADVLPRLGAMTWARAMGLAAVEFAVDWLRRQAGTRVVVDPFCGVGTALAEANRQGLAAIGIELARSRAQRARELVL